MTPPSPVSPRSSPPLERPSATEPGEDRTALSVLRPRWCPWAPTDTQTALLATTEREVLFGGAAGGGKSVALLMSAAQFLDVPGYSALLLRRTFPDLNLPKALIPLSKDWWMGGKARWSEGAHAWTFPSGSTVRFGFCEAMNDIYRYQGAEFQFIGVDELTQWEEAEYRYLFSRLRRPSAGPASRLPLRMRSTSNPGGRGHSWVKDRFLSGDDPDRLFIPSRLEDNTHLDAKEYIEALDELDPVTRARLLHGDWDVADAGALISREHLPVADALPPESHRRVVRFWDCAASAGRGCYTVGVRASMTLDGMFWIENVVRGQWDAGTVDQVILRTAEADGVGVAVDWEQEPGSAGVAVTASRRRLLAGWAAYGTPATGAKWVRAQPWAAYARGGRMRLHRGPWVGAYLDEVSMASPDMKGLVDQVDATSGAFQFLTRRAGNAPSLAAQVVTRASRASDLPAGSGIARPW